MPLYNPPTSGSSLSKATGAEVDTGTDSDKYIAPEALAASDYAKKTAPINAQTGTTYTLLAADNGKIVTLDNADPVEVTVPAGLGAGFNCLCVQKGVGQVSFVASSALTLAAGAVNHRQSHTKIAGQFGVASLVAYVANVFALAGDTAA